MHNHGHHHDHDEERDVSIEQQGLWITDNIELKSVGIDIGSSGTRIAFSKLKLKRMGQNLSSRYEVISREIIHQSEVRFTPYTHGYELIDEKALSQIIDEEYSKSGIAVSKIDTGVVLLTGEAMRRKNAEAIGKVLSEKSGNFVTVAAGHNQEALLAAHGSGAVKLSKTTQSRIINLDIGGGTTKFSLIDSGQVIETCTISIGGRILVHDEEKKIERIEPSAKYVANLMGFNNLSIGSKISQGEIYAITDWMANAILSTILGKENSQADKLSLTPRCQNLSSEVNGIVASGGIGEYIYERESRSFGDLGKSLGLAIRKKIEERGFNFLPASECIRATVIGVSEYTVQLSGNTILVSNDSLLPIRNAQVLRTDYMPTEKIIPEELASEISKHYKIFGFQEEEKAIALMFRWKGDPSYERLSSFATGIKMATEKNIANGIPLVLVFDQDVGRSIGALLVEESGGNQFSKIICIDEILLQDFDFIDLGKKIEPAGVVPVTVKSLAFPH
ncbi:MAG: ethanolamine ammonia-lyase reactivating factor EutA [Nitrososphaerales archaeon]